MPWTDTLRDCCSKQDWNNDSSTLPDKLNIYSDLKKQNPHYGQLYQMQHTNSEGYIIIDLPSLVNIIIWFITWTNTVLVQIDICLDGQLAFIEFFIKI